MGDPVTVEVTVPELGEKSFPMEYVVRSGETVAATGETTQVTLDPDTGEACRIPDGWRDAIATFEGHE
jgi:acyl-CoA thioester hydrolase